jgi:hypothetical protein
MITDSYIEKNGKKISKATLLFVSDSERLCDGCDESKKCASVSAISTPNNPGDVIVICKDCLQEIIDNFQD